MAGTRDNNLTQNQKKGISMVVSSLMKKYDFINNWALSPDWEKYDSLLYIIFYVDIEKLSKYFNLEIDPFYKEKYYDEGKEFKNSMLHTPLDAGEYGTPERNAIFDKSYDIKQNMESFMENMYEELPEQYQIFWGLHNMKHLVRLKVDEYISKMK